MLCAKDVIKMLQKEGNEVIIISTKGGRIEEIKETELGKVMDKIFSRKELGKGKGRISFLTKNEVSRINLTRNAFIMALTKHINGEILR